MAKATEVLMSEHRGIELMLTAMEREIPKLEAGDAAPVPVFVKGVDFLHVFADTCHHHKEEKLLFPTLAQRGVPVEGGPIGVMLEEHEQGRGHIRDMGAAIDRYQAGRPEALGELAAAARAYTQLLRAHIQKEDQILFQMANQALSAAEQEAMSADFDRVEVEIMGVGTHERYHQMLETL